ncbi:hypothetical protein RHGRI_016654 [Rhododendron griersonianum]|uniref:Uncharacterized protein n=1 Tax=Rhododendron griersonianum TaxID=479676 RepID=A0AAV6JV28_9ERIC|nr:hypothetical protein RHGRI_016654 [Rhododendron griersonianum]
MKIPEEKEVRYVARKLQGYASRWWKQLQYNREHQYKQPVKPWLRMKRLMSDRFLQSHHGQMLYEEYRRNLESKRLSRDNLELSYSFSSNKNYIVAATENSRDTSLRLLGSSQSSFESQQTDKDLSISDSSRSSYYDGYEIVEDEGDRVELEEVIFVEPNVEETVEVDVECSHCGYIEADGKEKFDLGISEKEETIIEVDNKKIGIDVGDHVVDDQNNCPLEVVDTNISVNEEILVSDIGETQGHINPMLKLAKLLHYKGFHITFVNTEFNHKRLVKSRGLDSLTRVPSFRFEAIPDGLPESDPDSTQDILSLLSDGGLSFTLVVAEELGIPDVVLWTASVCGFMGYFQYHNLIEKGYTPLKDASFLTNGYLDTVIEGIPGMEDSDVKREKVEGLVRELMVGEKGKEMKRRAMEWKKFAEEATQSSSSSSLVNLDKITRGQASVSNMRAVPCRAIFFRANRASCRAVPCLFTSSCHGVPCPYRAVSCHAVPD